MKADLASMLPFPIGRLRAGEALPFPLFLHLPRNGRMVAICGAGELPSPALIEALRARAVHELWVPQEARAEVDTYLHGPTEEDEAGGAPEPAGQEIPAEDHGTGAEAEHPQADEDFGQLATAAVRGLLGSDSTDAQGRDQLAASCGAVADALLARRRDPFFESVRMLRSLQPLSHHSVMVGNVAAALHAALGGDPDLGAELVAAGTLHDIGLALIPRGEATDDPARLDHALTAVSLLRACTDPVPEGVVALVSEHHAPPARNPHAGSELLIMANLFDDLCTGAETGSRLSPREAFSWLREHAPAGERGLRALKELGL